MGWLHPTSCSTRQELLAHLRSSNLHGGKIEMLASRAVGNHHWYVCRRKIDGLMWIGLDLMRGGVVYTGWGYKGLDEFTGLVHHDCPPTFVKKVEGSFLSERSQAWRQQVLEHAKHMAARPKPAPGMEVVYGGRRFRLINQLAPRKGWNVALLMDVGAQVGVVAHEYRMKAYQLARSEIVASP